MDTITIKIIDEKEFYCGTLYEAQAYHNGLPFTFTWCWKSKKQLRNMAKNYFKKNYIINYKIEFEE